MWHIETDLFAIAVFLIMFIKEFALHKERRQIQGLLKTNVQSDAFYVVLLLSIVSVIIDLVSSTAMNMASNWWVFQITMTVYTVSMPLLAATWVGYAYVLIHKDDPLGETLKKMSVIMLLIRFWRLQTRSRVFSSRFPKTSNTKEESSLCPWESALLCCIPLSDLY